MDANEFITKLKANNSSEDLTDLDKVFDEYKLILGQLPPKNRAPFSLNVLCVLCRNLDKAPKWRDTIDNKALLTLSIDCVRETRAMERADRVKTLASIYHLHRHVVRQSSPIPPELVLKISFMPFEVDAKHLLQEYSKTYWNILVDRLSYIERFRNKIPVIKLLPKLAEDVIKIIEIYDTVQFCSSIIVFLVKKLHFLYNEKHSKEMNQIYGQIFMKLSAKDMKPFKKLADKDVMDIYVKLNDCLYIVAENASKTHFKDSPMDNIVRTCISIVGHSPALFHCLQTYYSNTFCCILTTNSQLTYIEAVLNGLLVSFETTEKLGYEKAMLATYPFLNQFLRLYIEYNVTNCSKKPWKEYFNIQIQELCLKLLQFLMQRLKKCNQLLKCDNCTVRSGLHDSLRLSFLVKHFISISVTQDILITDILPILHQIINHQYKILAELNDLGCVNYEKCFRKLQTDVHNTAITLNKAQYFEFSIKLFNTYITYEINQPQLSEQKNISRALYNKSICELDSKLYEDALIDAFLSLVYGDALSSEKYMSLVIDIKAKELKSENEEVKTDDLQLFTVTDACEKALERELYGHVETFLKDLKFSELLKHEFAMYAKMWPSVTPIAGVWTSLLKLSKGDYQFIAKDAENSLALYEVVIETPTVVRTLTSDHFNTVVAELIQKFEGKTLLPDMKIIYASLLFLSTEFKLSAASQKYGWKFTEPLQNLDPDQVPANRTIPQECAATTSAARAVTILAELSPLLHTVSNKINLQNSLQIYQVFVQQLLNLSRDMEGLQLAHICCMIADYLGDNEAFVRNAGTLLYHGTKSDKLQSLITIAARKCKGVPDETSIVFLCDASIYCSKSGSVGLAAKLVQSAQAKILAAFEKNPESNLELSMGRVLEAQARLCKESGPSTLSAVNGTQRQYLSIANTGSKWHLRRVHSLAVHVVSGRACVRAARTARALRVWRRARAAAAAGLVTAAAVRTAEIYAEITDYNCFDDAQIKLDNRLKHVLGLQPSNETQPYYAVTETRKQQPFSPKEEVETMLENMVLKTQNSPSIPCTSVPAFKNPDFFNHNQKCECYACEIPICVILACQTSGLEASMYFRANEKDIARNYFNGVLKMFNLIEERLKNLKARYKGYDEFIVESVVKKYWNLYRRVKIEILIELSFFELSYKDYVVADEHIVEIHEVLKEIDIVNKYTTNEITNLMMCSAQLRKVIKKIEDTSLETEFESLKISPMKYVEPPKTPDAKSIKIPKATNIIVKDEEIPKKRKVIKLNLDEGSSEEKETKKVVKKHKFKVPVPTTKHVLEAATPRNKHVHEAATPRNKHVHEAATPRNKHVLEAATPRNKIPNILLTQPSEEQATPSTKNTTDLFTPKDSTPDQFFTPMTSIKTYTKKSLRSNIVKNLEQEFSTPKSTIKERADNVSAKIAKKTVQETLELPKSSKPKKEVKNTLKRATSPGKLCKETKELPRTRRLRKPVNFSLDEDDKR